ncbi:hypothetical protein NDU88_007500, partial [Pleurodeles waltl]
QAQKCEEFPTLSGKPLAGRVAEHQHGEGLDPGALSRAWQRAGWGGMRSPWRGRSASDPPETVWNLKSLETTFAAIGPQGGT